MPKKKELTPQEIIAKGRSARMQQYSEYIAKVESGKRLTPAEISAMAKLEIELQDQADEGAQYFQNAQAVADYANCARRTVYDAIKAGLLVQLPDKRFARSDVDDWMVRTGRAEVAGDDGVESFDKGHEDARYRHFRAERERLIVGKLEKELIPREEVKKIFSDRAYELSRSILLLSRRVAHRIAALTGHQTKAVTDIIDAEAKAFLTAYSRPIELKDQDDR